ncbi:guanylate kinase [bacterium]|nr:guanylate kinase [bacterium]
MTKLFVISGSSGVGKGTVIKEFLNKHPEFRLSISCTTRGKREGEEHGVNYFFLTPEEFKECISKDEFLEWAEFSGNHYGTRKAFVEGCLKNGENLILEIDTKGALNVKKIMPEAELIFIAPPSIEELEARLRGRHTESEEAIQKRLASIKLEIENSKHFDYKVVNDTVENAVRELEKIMM